MIVVVANRTVTADELAMAVPDGVKRVQDREGS